MANTKGNVYLIYDHVKLVKYSMCPRGCHRFEERLASRALNEKVVAAVGMKAGRDRGMRVIVPAINEQLVIPIKLGLA